MSTTETIPVAKLPNSQPKIASKIRRRRILPGYGLSLGYTVLYLSLIVIVPLSTIFLKSATLTWPVFYKDVANPRVIAAYELTFGTSLIAALVNVFFGLLVAWVLTRYTFPLKRLFDGLVDLPFALPTAVAGITLTTLYDQNGWIGHYLAHYGIKVAYTPLGITIALIFIGLPFIVRTVQPVMEEVDIQIEEAASSLGASRLQTFFRVLLPTFAPALITGFALAFARALGEYGSVVFISGNMPMRTEIVPLLIISKLEEFDYAGATSIAVVMLIASFLMLFVINLLQLRSARKLGSI